MPVNKFEFTKEMDEKIIAAGHGTMSDLAKEIGCSRSLLSHRRWVLKGKPPKRFQQTTTISSYENKKPPIVERIRQVGAPFARPAWFNENVYALARGVPPYAVTGQSTKPRYSNSGLLS